jgi:phosphoribosylanthranilate isomerase
MVKVKICGITNLDDALTAVEYGADALGFVFAPSPRQVTAEIVREMVEKIPPFICKVGVFVNSEVALVKETMSHCNLDLAQLHGDEGTEYCAALFPKVVKVFSSNSMPSQTEMIRYKVAAYMLDIGKGAAFNESEKKKLWQLAHRFGEYGPVILAGGLTSDNVARAIKIARPYAVDVSSGVETEPGKKDHDKLRAFLMAAKSSEHVGSLPRKRMYESVGADPRVCPEIAARGASKYTDIPQHRVGALSPIIRGGRQSARPMTAKMRVKLPRYNEESECHFITSVTRERKPIFHDANNIEILIETIRFYQERGDLHVLGYVVMPDHVHLMLIPQKGTISDVMRNIKAYSATTIRQRAQIDSDIWQDSFYDHIITGRRDFESKLNYIHKNPLRSKIVDRLDYYPYSSYINFYTDRQPLLRIELDQ